MLRYSIPTSIVHLLLVYSYLNDPQANSAKSNDHCTLYAHLERGKWLQVKVAFFLGPTHLSVAHSVLIYFDAYLNAG